jgi:hypothetical protein
MPQTSPKRPWFAGSAQQLADEHQQPTYIVTRTDECGPDDVILFASEVEDADLPYVLFGFVPATAA